MLNRRNFIGSMLAAAASLVVGLRKGRAKPIRPPTCDCDKFYLNPVAGTITDTRGAASFYTLARCDLTIKNCTYNTSITVVDHGIRRVIPPVGSVTITAT